MTLEQFKEKYNWSKNMSNQDMKDLLVFFVMLQLKMSLERNATNFEEFLNDFKCVITKKINQGDERESNPP